MNLTNIRTNRSQYNKVFWNALSEERIVVQTCQTCRTKQFYPRIICNRCQSDDLKWEDLPLVGELYSFTIVHRSPSQEYFPNVPYVLGVVKIDDGSGVCVQLFANIVDVSIEEVQTGMKVKATFPILEDMTTLAFTKY
ncbi:Zn-ribbon domain-containing OB-fold protein [Alkalihalobacterium alkalinitrilicum]|uniref:Zn-ribbon domain-containing OB-fold protein n=1 Tax=Alkalihalobacterium alkalinitrilicum TaxID=427920 RepID=UPI0009952696|nr:Zn-ribbon domain-containing OB-fold protein [Alkalihalobacterium alkalinitrilicum]